MSIKYFLAFLLVFSVVFSASAPEASIDRVALSIAKQAGKSITEAVAKGELGGNVAVVQTMIVKGSFSEDDVRHLVGEIEEVTSKIGSIIVVYNYKQIKDAKDKSVFAGRKGININRDKLIKEAKKIGGSYFSTLEFSIDRSKRVSVSMSVYDNETKVKIWSDTWSERLTNLYFFIDSVGEIFIDNFYFLGARSMLFIDVHGVASVGLGLGVVFYFSDKNSVYGQGYYKNIDIGSYARYIGSYARFIMALSPQMDLTFSLINSSLPNFTMFDIELFVRGGAFLGSSMVRLDMYNGGTVVTKKFFWRPVFAMGVNLLFAEKFYIFGGVDVGRFLGGTPVYGRKDSDTPNKGFVPVVGFGYRQPLGSR